MFVLDRVALFLLLIGAGVLLARSGVVGRAGVGALSAYVFWLGFPALLVSQLSHAPPPDAEIATPRMTEIASGTNVDAIATARRLVGTHRAQIARMQQLLATR